MIKSPACDYGRFFHLLKQRTHYCLLSILLMFAACRQEEVALASPDSATAPGLVELNYEVEHLLQSDSKNTDDSPTYEKALKRPFTGKNKVRITIYDDGTSAWRIEKMIPALDLTIKHQTPQGTEAKPVITLVDRSGNGSFYDKNNNLLFQHRMNMPTFKEAGTDISDGYSPFFAMLGVPSAGRLDALLAQAKSNGSIITHLDNDIVSIRVDAGKPVPRPAARTTQVIPFTTVQLYSKKSGLIIGATLYDGAEVVSQIYYSYATSSQKQLVPYIIHSESWSKHPVTGQPVKSESQIRFSNVSVTLNK